ncbi:MAG TPA: PASTA domain-containing protein [Thermoleophilaceae bacterium]|jgi:serine/threonine-protein kinase
MAEVAEGTVVDGRYSIRGRIGSGGMADVYLADDSHLGREVALKVLHRRFARDQQFVERFRREASAAAGLQHPNVVSVYDRGEHDGTYYIAMENLPGRTLRDVIQQEAPLDQERAIHYGLQILQAAGFAHRRGIVHRDFKPHNVIVAPDESLKVTDFGIARAGASEMTETGSIMGTAQYLSPEQAQGQQVDASSDLYSIGVMLYEMLAGRVPFTGDSAVSIALKHVSEMPPPLHQLRTDVHPALEAAVMRALAKDPASRYADADEFAAALEHALAAVRSGTDGGHTESWPPMPPPLPLDERERRRRWPWVTLVLLLLAGGIAAAILVTRPDQVEVPDVVGQQAPNAAAKLIDARLKPRIVRRTSDRPPGTVIRQDPAAGTDVRKLSTVRLFVSSGPGMTTVPDVVGKTQARAVKLLKKARLPANISFEESSDVDKGRVIKTTPVAFSPVQVGSRVDLVISSGPEQVKVPSVVGQQQAEAKGALEDAGLKVTVVESDSDSPKREVLSQSPVGGAIVNRGSRVKITVSRGTEKVEVPDVVGRSRDEASGILQGAGFTVNVVEIDTVDPDEVDHVIRQKPGARSQRKKGSPVTIYVGRAADDGTSGGDGSTSPPPGASTPPSL